MIRSQYYFLGKLNLTITYKNGKREGKNEKEVGMNNQLISKNRANVWDYIRYKIIWEIVSKLLLVDHNPESLI